MQMIDVLKRLAELDAKNPNVLKQGLTEGSDELYQNAIRSYTELVAHNFLAGGSEYIYGVRGFDSEMFGVDPKQAQKDFDRLFPEYLKKLQDGEQGVAEGEYGIPGIPEFAEFYNKKGELVGTSDHNGFHFTPEYYKKLAQNFDKAQIDRMAIRANVAKKLQSGAWTVKQGVAESQTPMNVTDKDGKSVGVYHLGQGFKPNEHGRRTYGLLPTDKVPAKFNFTIRPQVSLPKFSKVNEARFTSYGPGDPETWGPVTDPRDPRYVGNEDDEDLEYLQDLHDEIERALDSNEFEEDNVRGKSLDELPLSGELVSWLTEKNKELNLDVSDPDKLYDLLHATLDDLYKEIKSYEKEPYDPQDYTRDRDDYDADYAASKAEDEWTRGRDYMANRYEESLKECGDMMNSPMQPKTPASINMTAGSGEELSNMLKDIMSLAGVHKVEPHHLGHEQEPAVISTPPAISIVSRDGEADLMRSMMDKLNEPEMDKDEDELSFKEADNTPNETVLDPKDGPLGVKGPTLHPNTPHAADGRGQMNNPRGVTKEEQLMAEWKNFVTESNVKARNVSEGRVIKSHMGETEYNTYSGWKAACRRAGADTFDGDKNICQALKGGKGVGEWDGDRGTVYNDAHKKKMLDKPLEEKRGVPAHKEKQDKTSSERADAFISKGGKVTQLPYKEPKEKTKWGSRHIGTGKGTRGEQMGTGVTPSAKKPVVGEPEAKSDKKHDKKSDKKHDK